MKKFLLLPRSFLLVLLVLLGTSEVALSQKSLSQAPKTTVKTGVSSAPMNKRAVSSTFNPVGKESEMVLSQNTTDVFTSDGVSCPGGDNWWFRSYKLSDHGVTGNVQVLGMEFAFTSSQGSQNLEFYAYDLASFPGSFDITSAPAPIASGSRTITPAQAGQKLRVDFTVPANVSSSSNIVVAIYQPDSGLEMYLETTANETKPSYLASENCGLESPATVASVGFPDSKHFINLIVDAEGGGTAPFPSPYCVVSGNTSVEAISRVLFSDVDNASDPNGTVSHEDFTGVVANISVGEPYTIYVEGNTDGNYKNMFTAWIDWNQDGLFDEATERYDIGEIQNSTGTDGKQAFVEIIVPDDALPGQTRMRVMKRFNAYPTDSCTSGSPYGQTEDYSLNVTGGTVIPGEDCSFGDITTTSFDNGYNIKEGNNNRTAAGFKVEEGTVFTLTTITVDVNQQEVPNNAILRIWSDNNGPDEVIETITMAPTDSEAYGTAFGDPVYHLTFDLGASYELQAGTYWLDAKMSTPSDETVWWLASSEGSNPIVPQRSTDGGVTWAPDTNGLYLIFSVSGNCDSGTTEPGEDCSLSAASNNFENGASVTKAGGRVVAQDIVVAAGKDMLLDSVVASLIINGGVNVQNADIIVYEDNGGMPGSVVTTFTDVTPASAVSTGTLSTYTVWDVTFDTNFTLSGDASSDTTYWIGLSVLTSDASNLFWEFSTAGLVGLPQAYYDGTVWASQAGREGVYTFNAECTDIDTPTEDCSLSAASNNFENGASVTKAGGRVVAQDVVVSAGQTMTLESMELSLLMGGVGAGINAQGIDVIIYENNNGIPGAVVTTLTNVVPTSQVVNGDAFNYQAWLVDVPVNVELDGGDTDTTYWVGISVMTTDASNVFWEFSTAGLVGLPQAYYDGTVWASQAGREGVYVFTATCSDGGTTEPGIDCDQGDDSNAFENGYNITAGGTYRNADDFFVSADNTLVVKQIEVNVLTNDALSKMNFNFYNDEGGKPGSTVIYSLTDVSVEKSAIGSAFGYAVYTVLADVDLSFAGGADGTRYWMQPEAQVTAAFWETTSAGTLGEVIHTSESGGAWEADDEGYHGVFKLRCERTTPPPSQCLFDITASVEPITKVTMANVANSSSPTSTQKLEDFTSIHIEVKAGNSYQVSLEGYTDGDFTNYFTLFIDKSNGDWSDYLTFEIGSIKNSNGTDGKKATKSITIPSDLADGEYPVRIVKNYGTSPLNPCGAYSFGQGEDYTLEVGDFVGIDPVASTSFSYYPNPVDTVLYLQGDVEVDMISGFNLLGQQVISNKQFHNGQVDVSSLPTGAYLFRVKFVNGKEETFRVLKN